MMADQRVHEYWLLFCSAAGVDPETPYQTWYFGLGREDAEELVNLVLEGSKRATASLTWEYENKPEDAPVPGGYSVVTDFFGEPKCVIRTTELRIVPFNEVDADFAFDEGEGDRSLDHWRSVHWEYFMQRCAAVNREAGQTMPVICERFELLFPPEK